MLAKLALLRNASFTAAALRVGEFSLRTIIPTLAFYDFETFFSCNNKPVNWTDNLSGAKTGNVFPFGAVFWFKNNHFPRQARDRQTKS